MNDKQYAEKHIEKSFDWRLMRYLLSYAKPYSLVFALCFLLLIVVTLASISTPFLVEIAIDDVINDEERIYGVYDDYRDGSGFVYDEKFYSTLARHYHKPDKLIRIVKYEGAHYALPIDLDIAENYQITLSNGKYYIKTTNRLKEITKLTERFSDNLLSQSYTNLKQLLIGFTVVLVIGFAFNYGQILLLNLTSQKIVFRIREDLFKHVSRFKQY